jgi:hypothetical protein
MLLLAVKPKSTPLIMLFVELGAELMVIESVAEVPVMSKEYVAAGQPDPPPQFVSVSVPMVSALEGAPNTVAKSSKIRACRSFRIWTEAPRKAQGQPLTHGNRVTKGSQAQGKTA